MSTIKYPETEVEPFDFFKSMGINCGRIIKRFIKTMVTLSNKPDESIATASANPAEAKAIYRLIDNKKLTGEVIMTSYRKETLVRMKDSGEKVISSIQDTSECNCTSHKKTKGSGDGTHKNTPGLFVHSNLAVTPNGITPGLLDQMIWSRDPEERGKRNANRPMEEKESNKWLKSMENSMVNLPDGIRLVHAGDREADVFEFFIRALQLDQQYVVRAVRNRIVDEEGGRYFDLVREQPAAGQMKAEIPRDTRRNLKARESTLDIRYLQSKVRVPAHLAKTLGKDCEFTACLIHVIEIDPPSGVEPIEWFLVSNIPVLSADEAMEKVRWYVHRWKIERFHYILKSGCEVEKLQEREAERFKKVILMYSIIAIHILSIAYTARETPDASCETILEKQEWQVLYRIVKKTKNVPAQIPTIREAVHYIARLGGFLRRKSDGEPGVKGIGKD